MPRTRSTWVSLLWLSLIFWGGVICAAPASVLDHQNHHLEQRSAQLSDVLSGLGGLLGGAVSGLGNTVGGLTSGLGTLVSGVPLLGGLLDGTVTGLGSAVSGLGNGLGGTVGGILGASSDSPTPSPKPSSQSKPPQPKPSSRPPPSAPPKPTGWQDGGRDGEVEDEDRRGKGNGDRSKQSRLSVTTIGGDTLCRAYADTISTDPFKISVFRPGTKLEVTCFTRSGMDGASGSVRGDSTWLKTDQGCFVNRIDVQRREDFEKVLNFCPAPPHWVGILMAQYSRVDCYDCTSLDCPSHNIGSPPYVDLACSLKGESVLGNSTWIRSQEQNCYIPGSAFSQYGWLGSPGRRC